MNHKYKAMELYAIQWEFDRSKLEDEEFRHLDDKIFDEDAG